MICIFSDPGVIPKSTNNKNYEKDFKNVLLKENFIIGMKKYLEHYEDGKLISLAKEIGDTGHFIDEISNKFSEATNWVWNKDTVDEKIDETIIEYEIVSESNKLIIKSSTYIDCLQEWSKKCDMFRVSFNSIKKEVGSISELLEYLYHIKKNYDAVDSDKKGFLASLKRYSSDFKSFCAEQITLLKKVCQQQLSELSDDDVSEIASKYLNNVFTLENNEFLSKVGSEVDKYKANMAKYKLEQLWKEKTNTDSPLIWSGNYSMPILCMISPEEQYIARDVFETIISKSNDKNKIEEAIEYLNKYDKYDELNNQTIRDECFKNVLLKNYSVVIDNIEEIKASIKKQFPMIHPYYWLGNGAIESFVKSFALKNYNDKGVEKVDTIIDSMSADDLKKYLKQLIKDNMIVGIEIINNKK